MSAGPAATALRERPVQVTGNGGIPARRAMIRWGWRLFRREWRQQLLVLALITVAVGATLVGAAVATNTPPPLAAGFGTAEFRAVFAGSDQHLTGDIAALRQRFGTVDVIENQIIRIPGSIDTFELRAQDPRGPFGGPMLSLVAGRYPTAPGEVAVTAGVASTFGLSIGGSWQQGGRSLHVVGTVSDPVDFLDQFALVSPGQVGTPTRVTVLFDAPGATAQSLGPAVASRDESINPFNPETIVLAAATIGMLLIGLVAVGGFTVIAQRRLRSIGMLGAIGATDRNIRLVVRANGTVVGVVGTVLGAALGLVIWLAYRPSLQESVHHAIGVWQVPWVVIVPAMVLAVVAAFVAASRPARAITRVPIVTALSGRPAPPRLAHRSAVPGVALIVAAFLLLTYASSRGRSGGGLPALALGFVALVAAVVLLAPLCLVGVGKLARRGPVSVRLALRDLARYRARSGSALAAISISVVAAVLICVATAARYANMLDYAGPNLASNQVAIYTPNGPYGLGRGPDAGSTPPPTADQLAAMKASADSIAAALGSHNVIELDSVNATLQHAAPGRNFAGPIYVATPALLSAFGIKSSDVKPSTSILTMRPGLAGMSEMQLLYGDYFGNGPPDGQVFSCPANECLANPKMQTVGALPAGTSAPNTVITEQAVRQLGLKTTTAGWLVQTSGPLTAKQINDARQAAAAADLTIETRSSVPTVGVVLNWATIAGILLALGILAMTVGLIRSEAAADLRTLTAVGAAGTTRRAITGATAGALALLGAVIGTVAAYIAAIAYFRSDHLEGLSSLASVPVLNLLIILVGMPLAAALGGWLLGGRDPAALGRRSQE